MIPEAAVEAAAVAWSGPREWYAHSDEWRDDRLEDAKSALEAAAPHMLPAGGDIMTEGEVWKVKGLLHHDEFEASFSSWDSMDPEQKARTFYNEQTFLINTTLTRQRVIRSWDEVIDSKDGPETREQGETDCPEMGRNS